MQLILGQKSSRRRRFFGGQFWAFFGQLQTIDTGHFSCASGIFLGFLANYRAFVGRLGDVDSAHGNFLAPKQKEKK
jgi:hypothetical protein